MIATELMCGRAASTSNEVKLLLSFFFLEKMQSTSQLGDQPRNVVTIFERLHVMNILVVFAFRGFVGLELIKIAV